jgi:hypothetical protein
LNKDFQQLRKVLEGSDSFIAGGHRIVKMRQRRRIIPEWTRSDEKIRAILRRSFPLLETDPKQRAQAARWASIIHFFFRLQYTYRQVAAELQMTFYAVRQATIYIRRVAAGTWSNGRGKFTGRKRGRPKK